MIRAAVVLAALAAFPACQAEVVELGRDVDAATDAPPPPIDAAACTCRVAPCRNAGDCALTGGTCGADFFCTGSFGACTTDLQCQATAPDSVCTRSPTTTDRCGG